MMAENPALIAGMNDRGSIDVGKRADLILIDQKKEWTVKGEELETKCRWSPFEGRKMKGKVTAAWIGGKPVFQEGEFT